MMSGWRLLALLTGWLLVLLVVYLSLTPQPPQPMTFDNSDKFEHALAYGALSFWFGGIYRAPLQRLAAMTALVGLGVGLEYVQGWTGYRTFDLLDMAADGFGVAAGWLLLCTPLGYLPHWIKRRAKNYLRNWN